MFVMNSCSRKEMPAYGASCSKHRDSLSGLNENDLVLAQYLLTRFCQAPNRFDKDAVKDIMFGWDDTKKDPKRRDSRLIVIGDDRQTPLQRGALTAFRNYGVTVIPYSKLEERAPVELAA